VINGFYIDRPRFRPGTAESYLVACLLVAAAAATRLALVPWVAGVPFVTFFVAVIATTFLSGSRAAVVATVVSAVVAWLLAAPMHLTHLAVFQTVAFTVGSATVIAVVGVMRAASADVRRLNETLRAREMSLAEAYKAKSDFLARMSHEFRTPLNAIIGFSEMIRDAHVGPLPARYREYGGDINGAGRHLLSIVNDILDFSKLEDGRLELRDEMVSVAEAIEACRRMIAAMAERAGVALSVELPGTLPPIRSDELRFRQILLNLMSNAVKFTPTGGRVRVAAGLATDGVVITIADTGIGMKEEDIPIALEPFRQIDGALSRRFEGTGLGLPLAKALVELHGGALAIESAPGRGTVMRVLLPLARVTQAAA
jgi:signal transduction histidine kinase